MGAHGTHTIRRQFGQTGRMRSRHAIARRCRKPGADETGQHPAAEVMADDEQFLGDAAPTANVHQRQSAGEYRPSRGRPSNYAATENVTCWLFLRREKILITACDVCYWPNSAVADIRPERQLSGDKPPPRVNEPFAAPRSSH
jgi:hypothetical protein